MLVAQSALSHVRKLDRSLGTGVHEPVTADGVKLGSSDHLSQLFHVGRLYVDNIKALILDIKIPEVDPEIITADKCLSIAVHGYAVDVVGVGICVCSTRDGRHDSIVVRHPREFERGRILE